MIEVISCYISDLEIQDGSKTVYVKKFDKPDIMEYIENICGYDFVRMCGKIRSS